MKNLAEQPENGSYTYEDYLSWEGPERWELINGYAYMLAAPTTQHQRISMLLSAAIFDYLKDKPCEVFTAPFGVRLFPEEQERKKKGLRIYRKGVTVQPDLSIVCDPEQLDEHGCNGAPALVVEILSPSNCQDQQKVNAYMMAGVREMWIIDQKLQVVFLYLRSGKDYIISQFDPPGALASPTFPGLEIDLTAIFPNE